MADRPMFVAEIELTHPDLVLTETIQSVPEMEIELDSQIIADPETYYLFFEVRGEDFGAFDAAIEADPTVDESTVIVDADEFRVYRMRLMALEQLVLPSAAEYGMQVLHAVGGERGWLATLRVPDRDALSQFQRFCADRDVSVSINRLYEADDAGRDRVPLTEKQRETLRAAHRTGYFDEPRGASLEDVAARLGVSSSATSGRLRRALDQLVEREIDEE